MAQGEAAPGLKIDRWFNTPDPISLESLKGRVVVMEVFQMLCPGCVAHGIPQAQRIHDHFATTDVVVLGLHSVFEHHAAMTPLSLAAFLHEYRVSFPVGVDCPNGLNVPQTMAAYKMRGTPTLVVIDANGRLRYQWFGVAADLMVGAAIMGLIMERDSVS